MTRGFSLRILRLLWNTFLDSRPSWLDGAVCHPSLAQAQILLAICSESSPVQTSAIHPYISSSIHVGLQSDCFGTVDFIHREER
jgi:hypothetical protein